MSSTHQPPFKIRGVSQEQRNPLQKSHAYDQFIPSYAYDSYDDYSMRSSPDRRVRSRSPPRGARGNDSQFTSSRVHPRESRDRDRSRSRSPTYNNRPPRYWEDECRTSYHQRPSQPSPRPSPLGREQNGSSTTSSPRPKQVATEPTPITKASVPPLPPPNPVVSAAPTTSPAAGVLSETRESINKQMHDTFNACLLSNFREEVLVAEREVKKRNEEFEKGRPSHDRYPASRDSQQAAILYAKNALKEANRKLAEAEENVALLVTKFPAFLSSTASAVSHEQAGHEEYLEVKEKYDSLRKQFDMQKKLMDDKDQAVDKQLELQRVSLEMQKISFEDKFQIQEKKMKELILRFETQKKLFEDNKIAHDKQYGDLMKLFENEKTRRDEQQKAQVKFIEDQKQANKQCLQDMKTESARTAAHIGAQSKVNAEVSQRQAKLSQDVQDVKDGAASASISIQRHVQTLDEQIGSVRSDLSRVPADLPQILQSFGDQFKNLSAKPPKSTGIALQVEALTTETSTLRDNISNLVTRSDKDGEKLEALSKDIKKRFKIEENAEFQNLAGEFTALKSSVAGLLAKTPLQTEVPNTPTLSRSIKSLQDRVLVIERFDIQNMEERISLCEQNYKSFVRASANNQALDEVSKLQRVIDEQAAKLSKLSGVVDKQPATELAKPASRATSVSPPSNTADLSGDVRERLSRLETQIALTPTEEWVKSEIRDQDQAAADAIADAYDERLQSMDNRVTATEHRTTAAENKITNIEGKIEIISKDTDKIVASTVFQATISDLRGANTALDKKYSELHRNLAVFQDSVYSQQGFVSRITGLEHGFSLLDARYNNINTLDLHTAMAEQFQQQVGPQLQKLQPLETLLTATASRVAELEKLRPPAKDSHSLDSIAYNAISARVSDLEKSSQLIKNSSSLDSLAHDTITAKVSNLEKSMELITDSESREAVARDTNNKRFSDIQEQSSNLEKSLKKMESTLGDILDSHTSQISNLEKLQKNTESATDVQRGISATVQNLQARIEDFATTIETLQKSEPDRQEINQIHQDIDQAHHSWTILNNKVNKNYANLKADVEQAKNGVFEVKDKIAEIQAKCDPSGQNSKFAPASSPALNSRIRDAVHDHRKPAPAPAANGSSKKRRFENGYSHSPRSSLSATSNSRPNGSTRLGSSDSHANKRQKGPRRRKPAPDGDDEDDGDFSAPLDVPTISDSGEETESE